MLEHIVIFVFFMMSLNMLEEPLAKGKVLESVYVIKFWFIELRTHEKTKVCNCKESEYCLSAEISLVLVNIKFIISALVKVEDSSTLLSIWLCGNKALNLLVAMIYTYSEWTHLPLLCHDAISVLLAAKTYINGIIASLVARVLSDLCIQWHITQYKMEA